MTQPMTKEICEHVLLTYSRAIDGLNDFNETMHKKSLPYSPPSADHFFELFLNNWSINAYDIVNKEQKFYYRDSAGGRFRSLDIKQLKENIAQDTESGYFYKDTRVSGNDHSDHRYKLTDLGKEYLRLKLL